MNKIVSNVKSLINHLIYTYYKMIFGRIGKQTHVKFSTKFDLPQNIYIGNKVSIGRMSWLAAKPLTGNPRCSLTIGDSTYIGNFAHIYCTSKITIKNNVLFADRVYVTDNLHSYQDINIPIISQPILQISEVTIEEGAWIGENTCIIGANVGKNSVVGANSVVTKSIPDYCVAVGAPAKIIKRYSFEQQAWLKTDAEGNFI